MSYVLEGEWTGYTSRQRRVVHREVITEKRAEKLRSLHRIVYTDGTSLVINVREAKLRERVVSITGYTKLIREAEAHGGSVVRVADLADGRPKATQASAEGSRT